MALHNYFSFIIYELPCLFASFIFMNSEISFSLMSRYTILGTLFFFHSWLGVLLFVSSRDPQAINKNGINKKGHLLILAAWSLRRTDVTGTHVARWHSVPRLVVSQTWVWDAYRRFRILETLS